MALRKKMVLKRQGKTGKFQIDQDLIERRQEKAKETRKKQKAYDKAKIPPRGVRPGTKLRRDPRVPKPKTVKDIFMQVEATSAEGGVADLRRFKKTNPEVYYKLLTKMLPRTAEVTNTNNVVLSFSDIAKQTVQQQNISVGAIEDKSDIQDVEFEDPDDFDDIDDGDEEDDDE